MTITNTNCHFDLYFANKEDSGMPIVTFETMREAEHYIKEYFEKGHAYPLVLKVYQRDSDMYSTTKFQYRQLSKSRIQMYVEL